MKNKKISAAKTGGSLPRERSQGSNVTLHPRQIVQGICYHLVDEHLARSIDADCVHRTIASLELEKLHLSIPRSQWYEMTNSQRLNLLLRASELEISLDSNDVGMLRFA